MFISELTHGSLVTVEAVYDMPVSFTGVYKKGTKSGKVPACELMVNDFNMKDIPSYANLTVEDIQTGKVFKFNDCQVTKVKRNYMLVSYEYDIISEEERTYRRGMVDCYGKVEFNGKVYQVSIEDSTNDIDAFIINENVLLNGDQITLEYFSDGMLVRKDLEVDEIQRYDRGYFILCK